PYGAHPSLPSRRDTPLPCPGSPLDLITLAVVTRATFGVFGLAVMGQNLARNVASRGVSVAVYNRTPIRTERMISERRGEGQFLPSFDVPSFVASIERPRTILVMVKAGSPVDEAIAELRPHLSPGDIVIDGGNSYFKDTQRRCAELEGSGLG